MADHIVWKGASGKTYKYWFLGTTLAVVPSEIKHTAGNYMFVKRSGSGWLPVYIGQTGSLRNRIPDHPELPCAKRNSGTRIMSHTTSNAEQLRRKEESDLIANYSPPCNQAK